VTAPARDGAAGDGVTLLWIPVGAGGRVVPVCGRWYETLVAHRERRRPRPLFHAALQVRCGGVPYCVEMAPVWSDGAPDRGVVVDGPVWSPLLGRSRLFRYEVRCWRHGRIPDASFAVGAPVVVTGDGAVAERLLRQIRTVPPLTWGRDEVRCGDMWNSNSLVSWLLVRSGVDAGRIAPPSGGRAPGWRAGLVLAARADRTAATSGRAKPGPSPGID